MTKKATRKPVDAEMAAMRRVIATLETQPKAARRRILDYIRDREDLLWDTPPLRVAGALETTLESERA